MLIEPSAGGNRRTPQRMRRIGTVVLTTLTVSLGIIAATTPAGRADAGTRDDSTDAERQLAERFAPIVVVKQQDEPCDTGGEPFEPAPVEIVLDNPEIFLRQVGNDDPVAMRGPAASDIFDLREGWYLDFPGDALEPGCVFEEDFGRFYDGQSVAYAHVASEVGEPDRLALQYWFFWYHNPAKNDHEGDWEFIQLLFDVGTAEEAVGATPISVGYAQHTGGERSSWTDAKLERVGDRPVVYAARGSHASYFGQALYLGRSGREGFGCDNTDEPSRPLEPEVVMLPDEVTDRDDPLAWLAFQGRWGQREAGFFNGPTGPFEKDRWTEPVTWEAGLRDSSVVIPAGDRFGDGVITVFCDIVEFGSSVLVTGLRSPALFAVTAIGLIVAAIWLVRRTRWSPVHPTPLRSTRVCGQILACGFRVWREHPLAMIAIGLVYVPVAIVTSLVQRAVLELPLVADVIGLAGQRGEVAVLLALFVGGIGNLFAFSYVAGVVARRIDEDATGHHTLLSVATMRPAEVRALTAAILRGAAIVIVLLVSVVGIPWAIRQLVRYQVAPQVITIEGADGAHSLRRSSDLVRRRWWWTAGIVAIVHVSIGIVGVGAALVVLLAVTAIPLWLFNVISAAIYAVLVPVGGAAMASVYGTLASGDDLDIDPDREPDLATAGR